MVDSMHASVQWIFDLESYNDLHVLCFYISMSKSILQAYDNIYKSVPNTSEVHL